MFDHEKLHVYQEAIQFVAWAERLCDQCERRGAVTTQLDRAATSVALNTAEANGKPPGRDRCRFLDIARGSALECAACLDVLCAQGRISEVEASEGKERLRRVVSMLVGLIRAHSDRVCEEAVPWDECGLV